MTSSKWNERPWSRRTPSVCIAPAGSCWPDFPFNEPPFLNAYIDWLDLDPLDPTQGSGYARLERIDAAPTYYGEAKTGPTGVAARITPSGLTDRWEATIYHLDDARPPYSVTWPNVWIDPDQPFATGLLRIVNIPGKDQQMLRIML